MQPLSIEGEIEAEIKREIEREIEREREMYAPSPARRELD